MICDGEWRRFSFDSTHCRSRQWRRGRETNGGGTTENMRVMAALCFVFQFLGFNESSSFDVVYDGECYAFLAVALFSSSTKISYG
ncbi:hypothetical protein QYF36_010601 [Acer negundo]|nr:hypothetical protein QYF36_010601 [Acer negundo]